jgi:hypothetical protein
MAVLLSLATNAERLRVHGLGYNLADFLPTLALPLEVTQLSSTRYADSW